MRHISALLLVGVLLAAAGCDEDSKTPAGPGPVSEAAVPDFTLPDVNPNSATNGQDVSPRDHLGRISAWYFGHST